MMDLYKIIFMCISTFFLIYLIIYSTFLIISVTVGSIALYEQRRREKMYNYVEHDYYFPISIIVPAYNEEKTIIDTILSLLSCDYKLYEIIVVDDGSKDSTSQKLIEYFKMEPLNRPIRKKVPCKDVLYIHMTYQYKIPITLIIKENGGKSDSLNMGINASEFPYFICMDADSMLQKDALIHIAQPILEDNSVVACGGLVRIINDVTMKDGVVIDYKLPKNLILAMQVFEYDRTFLASRLFFDKFNGNLIISGAFGLFQKDLVISVGGYNINTMGEDMELVVRLHAFCRANLIPYKIKYAPSAICWSQAPSTLKDLKKQRRRWHIGLFQSIKSHADLLFNPKHGLLSFVSFLYYLIYELLSPYIEVFGVISILIAAYLDLINIPFMVLFFVIYAVFNCAMSLIAFFSRIHATKVKLRGKDLLKAFGISIFENILLRTILAYTRFTALIGYKGKKDDWGSISREYMKNIKPNQNPNNKKP